MLARTVTPAGLRRAAALTALAGACLLGLPADATADETQTLTVELVASAVAEAPGAKLTFLVKLSDGPDSATFDYAASGTATAGADYTLAPKTGETVAAGGTVTIDVPLADDAVDEDAETVRLDVTNVEGAANAAAAATGTIEDDDDAPPEVTPIANLEVEEADVTRSVDVVLSAPSGKTITIDYQLGEAGTATRGSDFTFTNGTLTYAPGVTTQSIPVGVLEDTLAEPSETIVVNLLNHVNVRAGDVDALVTIKDDGDPAAAPTIDDDPRSALEGNGPGTTELPFKVTLTGPRPATTLKYRTVLTGSDTATTADYVEVDGAPLPFSAGTAPQTLSAPVQIRRDAIDELNETFTIQVVDPATNAVLAAAVGTIVNDDDNSLLSVGDTTADEPTTGTGTMEFTITLAPASERTVGVTWATANGTATAGADFTAAAGSVTFEPGETVETVKVTLLGDAVNEENETLALVLSEPTGILPTKLVDPEGLGTLVDKNAPPSLSISDPTAREGVGASFVVTLAGTTLRTVTVAFRTADGVARADSDYVPRVGTLTFAPGEKTKTLDVTVADDDAPEPSEDFAMRLTDAVNATITKSSGRATIEASDQRPGAPAPTPAPTPQPPAQKRTPAAVKAPRMVLGPRTVRVGAAGLAGMTVTCQAASPIACAGTVRLERAAKPLLKLGQRVFSVRRGAKRVVPVKLTPRALSLLRRQGSMRARVVVVYKKSVGTGKAIPGLVTLVWVAPKRPA